MAKVAWAGAGWRADGHTTETRPQQGRDNARVKISPGTQRHVHTCSVARLKVSFFITSIGDGRRMWVFLLKRLISLLSSIMDKARGQKRSLISPRISFQLVRINTFTLAGTCDGVISSVTQQITHHSDVIGLIEEKLRLSMEKLNKDRLK